MVDLSIIIVTYNNEADISACLDSVAAIEDHATEIIVIDNGSSDRTIEVLHEHAAQPIVIAAGGNRGFGSGVNEAARRASGTFLLLLNPDAVLLPGCAERLIEVALAVPEATMLGGLTRTSSGVLSDDEIRRLPGIKASLLYATGASSFFKAMPDGESLPTPTDVEEVPFISGSLLLIRAADFRQLGGFDERYFMYSEDTDLCHRIHQQGGTILVVPDAQIRHDGGASSPDDGRKTALMLAGRSTFLRLQWSGWRRSIGLGSLWLGTAVRSLAGRAHPRGRRWVTAWRLRRWWWPGYQVPLRPLPPI